MGGKTTIEQPTQPTAPSVTSSMSDYIENYPRLFELMQQYQPQEAALQVNLAQQYAQPLGEAYLKAQQAMYPTETAITDALNKQIQEGISSDVPDWMKQDYQSNMNSILGTNVNAGIGADYVSRGLMQQKQDWQNYYRNLGLSVTGRQPIYGAQTPQTTNQLSQFTPNSVMSMNQGVYGTQAGMYNNQYNAYASQAQQSPAWMNMLGTMGGTALGIGASAATGGLSNAGGFLPKIF